MWFPNRSNSNQAVQAQKMARDWKFGILKVEKLYYHICVAKTKAKISFAVTAKLISCEADQCLCFRVCRLLVFS